MALFGNRNNPQPSIVHRTLDAFSVDVIQWEPKNDAEASVIAHKFETEDFPSGSQLIVGPAQMAVFVNNLTAGNSLNEPDGGNAQMAVFIGPCRIKLETGETRFAPFRSLAHALTRGDSAYHSTVYFINTTFMNELNWGTTAPIVVEDPKEEVNVHVRAFGLFGAHIEHTDTSIAAVQALRFLRKVVGTRADYTRDELIGFMRAKILEYVPTLLAGSVVDRQISVLEISTKLSEFSDELKNKLTPYFDQFGLTLDNFSFHSINVPEEDIAAINEMKIERKRLQKEAEGKAMAMDIESEAISRKREREGYTYQQEQAYNVLGQAASNEGTAGSIMGTGLGLGMGAGVGVAIGGGMGALAQNMIPQAPPSGSGQAGTVPCPACGKPVPKGAKFCMECGTKMPAAPVCARCGYQLPPNAKFCPECGAPVAPPAPSVCPKCGKPVTPGAKFCMECGATL
ncbi:MAG: SPFH domain-containing protein [Clostridia bacterium]|nr:SPFH domain-containing protein [Clostridia bacterium]